MALWCLDISFRLKGGSGILQRAESPFLDALQETTTLREAPEEGVSGGGNAVSGHPCVIGRPGFFRRQDENKFISPPHSNTKQKPL